MADRRLLNHWTTSAVSVLVLLSMLVATSSGVSITRQQQVNRLVSNLNKRVSDGNPCPDAEKPFPCKSTSTCIPMGYVCDANIDCEDGYDENEELCAAANRPPIEDIMNFLEAEKGWIIDNIFAGRKIEKIAHSLVVSQRLDDFRQRLGMSHDEIQPLKKALEAIESGNARAMTSLGMPPSAWNEVSFIFSKLIKSGFTE